MQKLHALVFAHYYGAVLMQEVLCSIKGILIKLILQTEVVIIINIENALQNAEALGKKSSSSSVFLKSLTLLKFSKDNTIRKIIFIVAEGYATSAILRQHITIPISKEIAGMLISIIISLIAIVFTGYALFQALINDRLLITLLSVDSNKNANLAKTNEYFAEVMTICKVQPV